MEKRKRKPSFKRLNKKRDKLLAELTVFLKKNFIRGSIRLQGNRCGGSKNCKCKRKINPILHGPYPYLSFRGKKSNHSILLGKSKKECAEKASLPKLVNPETGKTHNISPHRLRDSFAVHAVKLDDSGDGLRLLQEHLGHRSFDTTAKYRKISGTEHQEWYERLWSKES